MKPELRQDRILEHLRECERASVEELAQWLGSSRETIRRDLTVLAESARIRKYHGGAAMATLHREDRFSERMRDAVRQKRAVAATAAALFESGSSLFVDVGTTTLLFAEALGGREDLTVITNGVDIARVLASSGVKVFLVGGELNAETAELLGTLAVEQIGRFFASDAVITVAGLSVRGAMDCELEEAQIARAMIAQARTITVIADASKLGRDGLFQVCPLEVLDRLVVDRAPDSDLAQALTFAGVELVIAKPLPNDAPRWSVATE